MYKDVHNRILTFKSSAYHISLIKRGLCVKTGVGGNLWFKKEKKIQQRRRRTTLTCAALKDNNPGFKLNRSFQVIISSLFPCQHRVIWNNSEKQSTACENLRLVSKSSRRLRHIWHILIYKVILGILPIYLQPYILGKGSESKSLPS